MAPLSCFACTSNMDRSSASLFFFFFFFASHVLLLLASRLSSAAPSAPYVVGQQQGDKSSHGSSKLFRHYIGVSNDVDVELESLPSGLVDNMDVEVHFILSFTIDVEDFDGDGIFNSTNGKFLPYWNPRTLTPEKIKAFKAKHKNVKVMACIGGDSISAPHNKSKPRPPPAQLVQFHPQTFSSWVRNAETSLTSLVLEYGLDGIDIDYEHFEDSPELFARSIGNLVARLKKSSTIKVASIAPFPHVQSHYVALWKGYGRYFDYVNFQFYVYDSDSSVEELVGYYKEAVELYSDGKVLLSYSTDPDAFSQKNDNGITPANTLLAYSQLQCAGLDLPGIFVWADDNSASSQFKHEIQAQDLLLANTTSCSKATSSL